MLLFVYGKEYSLYPPFRAGYSWGLAITGFFMPFLNKKIRLMAHIIKYKNIPEPLALHTFP